jgi:hypothetical protein
MRPSTFVFRSALLTLASMAVLSACARLTTQGATQVAKALHSVAGYPAPDMLVDLTTLYSAPVCLAVFIGLTTASTWAPWKRRLSAALTGGVVIAIVLVLEIILGYSPYLADSALREFLTVNLMLFAILPLQILLWLVLIGLPGDPRPQRDPPSREGATAANAVTLLCALALSTAVVGLCLIGDSLAGDRSRLAEDCARGRDREAFRDSVALLTREPGNTNLTYLAARLARRVGDGRAAQVMLYQSCAKSGLEDAYYREYRDPPLGPLKAKPRDGVAGQW